MELPADRRVIRVYMDMRSTQLYLSFTNFTAGKKLKKEGKLFRSTKGRDRGFGLVRIDAIVERLEGYISRNSEDGAFTTEILLPQVYDPKNVQFIPQKRQFDPGVPPGIFFVVLFIRHCYKIAYPDFRNLSTIIPVFYCLV